jgi:membrane protein DedA with SNARE-associated domain
MSSWVEFVVRDSYPILFFWILVEQLGLPLPGLPLLLAAGALAGGGHLNLAVAVTLPVLACMCSDFLWFQIGRHRGIAVLGWICRLSLEPDSCVRRTEDIFMRHGAKSLLISKFVPGLNLAAAPLAGIFRMRIRRFLPFDALGALFWAGGYVGLGFAFSEQLEKVALYALRLGASLVVLLGGGLLVYIAWKYLQRQKFLRELRIARIAPEELKKKLDAGEDIQIVDLRHPIDFAAEPQTVPGALHFDPKEIGQHQELISRDRDIVLYCT